MAIFTITNGESTNLAVVKVSPIIQDCFTLYEYVVNTNNGDNIDVTLTGNHFEAVKNSGGTETSFNDTTSVTYSNSLSIRFLLLNSGTTGVYSSATINITNTTTGNYYENFVERQDDTANCYAANTIPTQTSQLLNDGHDGVNPFLDTLDSTNFAKLSGGPTTQSFAQNINQFTNVIVQGTHIFTDGTLSNFNMSLNDSSNDMMLFYRGSGAELQYKYTEDEWRIDGNRIITEADALSTDADNIIFDSYLTLTSPDVQAAIEELKDELDAAVIGSFTLDTVPTDSSTNAVESNGIFDALATKGTLSSSNTWLGVNTFSATPLFSVGLDVSLNYTIELGGSTNGLEIYSTGGANFLDVNGSSLVIRTNSSPDGWTFTQAGLLTGDGSTGINTGYVTVAPDPYDSGWDGSMQVPTKNDVYDKIQTLGSSAITISGTPVVNQIVVWVDATTVEGTTDFTYDGANLQLTGDIGSTGTRITKGWFTDLQVTNTITGNISGESATVTGIGNLTGDVTSVNRATTISVGAVDIAMLSASGTPSATTYLRGDNTWATPSGAGGDVYKVGTPANDQLGVWTGDGTIEGDSNLQWNGTSLLVSSNIVWHAGNDGTGSGMDADTLDSFQAASFLRSDAADIKTSGALTFNDSIVIGLGTSTNSQLYGAGVLTHLNLLTGDFVISDTSTERFRFIRTTGELQAGSFSGGNIRLTDTGDAAVASTTHAFQIGEDASANIIMDTNEIMARFNGAVSPLYINNDGGQVETGGWFYSKGGYVHAKRTTGSDTHIAMFGNSGTSDNFLFGGSTTGTFNVMDTYMRVNPTSIYYNNGLQYEIWHQGNDGSGSGLDADTVDGADYATGSFSCTLTGSISGSYTIGSQSATYVKMGKLVAFTIFLTSVSGTAPLGALTLNGLPFTCAVACIVPVSMTGSSVTFYSVHGMVQSTNILFERQDTIDGNNLSTFTNTDFTTGTIRVSGIYITA